MSNRFTKTLAAGLAVLTLGGAAVTTSLPAQAHPIYHPHPYGHYGWGWGIGGLAAGLAIGAIAARSAEPACGYVRQPMYDRYGDFMGYTNVPTC